MEENGGGRRMSLPRGVIWITGASTGIGHQTALLLARHGWKVAVSARDSEALEELQKRSQNIHAFPLDVTDAVHRKEVFKEIRHKLGPVDVLVNNAGFGIRGAVEEIDSPDLRTLFDVNVFAPLALTRLVVPEMRDRREGRIIMVSSIVGRLAFPLSGAYSATKFALEAFSDSLRIELNPWNIKVAIVEPGPIATKFQARAKLESDARLRNERSPYSRFYKAFLKTGMVSRRFYWGPATVAEAISHAAESEKPKRRYPVHPMAFWGSIFARILPASWLDYILGAKFGFFKPASL